MISWTYKRVQLHLLVRESQPDSCRARAHKPRGRKAARQRTAASPSQPGHAHPLTLGPGLRRMLTSNAAKEFMTELRGNPSSNKGNVLNHLN